MTDHLAVVEDQPRTVEYAVLTALAALLCVSDMPRALTIGGLSLMAALTVATAAALVLMQLAWVDHPSRAAGYLWPLLGFGAWALGRSVFVGTAVGEGSQNLLLIAILVLSIGIAARTAYDDDRFAPAVLRVVAGSASLASWVYLGSVAVFGPGNSVIFGARSFALAGLIGVCAHVARARGSSWKAQGGLVICLLAMMLSLSRTATVCAIVVVCVGQVLGRRERGQRWVRGAVLAGVAICAAWVAVARYEPLNDRVFGGDRAATIGSAQVNTSGREQLWGVTRESISASPWLGQGAGSAQALIESEFTGISHPHNDYLRLVHDYGIVGMTLWALGVLGVLRGLLRAVRHVEAPGDRAVALAGACAAIGISVVMITDNVIAYAFVVAPAGVLIGAGLGIHLRAVGGRPANVRDPIDAAR